MFDAPERACGRPATGQRRAWNPANAHGCRPPERIPTEQLDDYPAALQCAFPIAVPIGLSDDEREQLQAWTRHPTSAQALALRSRTVLACGDAAEQPNSQMRKTSGQGLDALCSVSFVGTSGMER